MHQWIALILILFLFAVCAYLSSMEGRLAEIPPVYGASRSSSMSATSNNKAIALLELSGDGAVQDDVPIAVSLQYIGNLNGWIIPIVDTRSSIERTMTLVQRAYDQGYRIFIGFSVSTTLSAVLPWFLEHQDTVGISLLSTASSLDVHKNVIRLNPSDTFSAFFMAQFINRGGFKHVLFISNNGDLVSSDLYQSMLTQLSPGITNTLLGVNSLATDTTSINAVKAALVSLPPNSVVVPSLPGNIDEYLEIATTTLMDMPVHLDTLDVPPTFATPAQSAAFAGKYNFLIISNILSLTNQELEKVLGSDFSQNAYDAYNIARIGASLMDIRGLFNLVDHLLGHTGSLELNNFNDRLNSFFTIQLWNGVKWVPSLVNGNTPQLGIFQSAVLTSQNEI